MERIKYSKHQDFEVLFYNKLKLKPILTDDYKTERYYVYYLILCDIFEEGNKDLIKYIKECIERKFDVLDIFLDIYNNSYSYVVDSYSNKLEEFKTLNIFLV